MPTEQIKQTFMYEDEFLQSIFDAFPAFVFIVDHDVRFHFWNAPARELVGNDPAQVFLKRGGEVLHCIRAEGQDCGKSTFCNECVIRSAVSDAFANGKTRREFTRMQQKSGDTIAEVYLMVTVSPFHYREGEYALLFIEDVSHLLPETTQQKKGPDPTPEHPAVTLSASELEILKWLRQGKSSWAISRILDMNIRTVNYHVYNIIGKLDAMNRTHAVAIALEMGLIHD